MSPRTGRPTIAPKRTRVGVRLTDEEILMLNYCSTYYGKTMTEIISMGIQQIFDECYDGRPLKRRAMAAK